MYKFEIIYINNFIVVLRVPDLILGRFSTIVGEEDGDVVAKETKHESDKNDGQDHPHTNIWIKQELGHL